MGTLTYPFTLTAGQPENINQLNSNLAAIQTVLNGGVDSVNLAAALAQILGLNAGGNVGRGAVAIPGTESRTNAAYGLMPTPDRVQSVVLATNGLIFVAYQAVWQEAVNNNARAAIFIGANQVQGAQEGFGPVAQEARIGGSWAINTDTPLSSDPVSGLTSHNGAAASGGAAAPDVTTGQLVSAQNNGTSPLRGGVATIFAAAGTYDISVQYKASGGVTVKNRRLWVWTMGF